MRKFKHPMAVLRFVLGKKNQAQFAKELGVTKSLIKKIERGEREISPQLFVWGSLGDGICCIWNHFI